MLCLWDWSVTTVIWVYSMIRAMLMFIKVTVLCLADKKTLHSNTPACHLLRLASRSHEQPKELISRRLPRAMFGCHKRWLTARSALERNALWLNAYFTESTHPNSRCCETMGHISCSVALSGEVLWRCFSLLKGTGVSTYPCYISCSVWKNIRIESL